jgi:hypothetical protein
VSPSAPPVAADPPVEPATTETVAEPLPENPITGPIPIPRPKPRLNTTVVSADPPLPRPRPGGSAPASLLTPMPVDDDRFPARYSDN